jgi:hypothetical protein
MGRKCAPALSREPPVLPDNPPFAGDRGVENGQRAAIFAETVADGRAIIPDPEGEI